MGRGIARSKFAEQTARGELKIQVGARGQKIGSEWVSIDRFDDSDLIDKPWDLHCIPLNDGSADCYVCNAVLEHVEDPHLAVFEMFRTLRVGGSLWVEVPFNQFYHAHPNDFTRWTVAGLKNLLEDFTVRDVGVSVGIAHEVPKILSYISSVLKNSSLLEVEDAVTHLFKEYENSVSSPRLYSTTYAWAIKSEAARPEKQSYFGWRRDRYVKRERNHLLYDPNAHDM